MLKHYLNKIFPSINKLNKSNNFLDYPHGFFRDDNKADANAYLNNVVVYKCVNLIANSASHIPWFVYVNQGNKKQYKEYHPAAKLLKNPNPEKAGADFFAEIIASLLLYGNSYVLLPFVKSEQKEMYNLHAASVEPVVKNNKLIGYKYNTASQSKIYQIDPIHKMGQILHIKNYHPSDSIYGLSPLSAASRAINLHARTMEWNKALLSNSARPSGALVFQDSNGYLTDEQFERLKEQFYENFTGSTNSGKPLILEGGLKWQDTTAAEKLEKFLELKDSSARDIAIAFNVPPQLLGINGDNTYSNMQEARLALWEETIIPLLDKLADNFSSWFSYWYQEDLRIDFDRDAISCLIEKRENLWSKISAANFMTINEKRALFGLDTIAGGDTL